MRDDDLEGLPGPDVFLGAFNHALEIGLRHVAADLGERLGGNLGIDDGHGARRRFGQFGAHSVEPRDGISPRPFDALAGVVEVDRVGDEQHGAVAVVKDGDVGGQHHGDLGKASVGDGVAGQALPAAHRVIRHCPDEPGGQRGKARDGRRREGSDGVPDRGDRVAPGRHPNGGLAEPTRDAVALGQGRRTRCPDDGVARPEATVFGRFQQEGPRSARGELAVDRQRGLAIGHEPADDGNNPPLAREHRERVQ